MAEGFVLGALVRGPVGLGAAQGFKLVGEPCAGGVEGFVGGVHGG